MRTPVKFVAAISALSVAVGGGLSIASAKPAHKAQTRQTQSQSDQSGQQGERPGRPRRGGPPFIEAAAKYLGLERKALCDQLHDGKTLAQVAEAQGKSVDGLKQAIVDDAKSHLDKAVADGRITADQEQQRLDDLNSHLDVIVNKTPPKDGRGHRPPPMGGEQGAMGEGAGQDADAS